MDYNTDFFKKKEGFLGQQSIVLPPNTLNEITNNDLVRDFYLTAIGYYPHAKFHERKRISGSSEYILLYCIEGQGKISISGKKLKIKPNQYIIFPPNLMHQYKSSLKNPWTIYWIHFSGNRADLIFKRYQNDVQSEACFIPYKESRIKIFEEICEILHSSFDTRNIEISNFKLTYLISSFVYQKEINPHEQTKDVVSKTIEFMRKNLHNNYKINDFAQNHNLSVSRFSEIFRKKTGYPPIAYFIKLKVQQSCQYLYFTDMTIKEICNKIGFDDQYYFSRAFKKIMGVAPSKYKAKYKK